jgi:hypothetical protein
LASALPAPEQTDKFCDLFAGWKLDSFLLIRYRHEIPFAYERPLCAAVIRERPSMINSGDVQTHAQPDF